MFSYRSVKTYVLGAQKNRLIETILLSTHNICFGWGIKNSFSRYTLLTESWSIVRLDILPTASIALR